MTNPVLWNVRPFRRQSIGQPGLEDSDSDCGFDAYVIGGFQQDRRLVQALNKPFEIVAHQDITLEILRRGGQWFEVVPIVLKLVDQCPYSNGAAWGPTQNQGMIVDRLVAMLPQNGNQNDAARQVRLQCTARAETQDIWLGGYFVGQDVTNREVGFKRWSLTKEPVHYLRDSIDVVFHDPVGSE